MGSSSATAGVSVEVKEPTRRPRLNVTETPDGFAKLDVDLIVPRHLAVRVCAILAAAPVELAPEIGVGGLSPDVRPILSWIDKGMRNGERYSVRPQEARRWIGRMFMVEHGCTAQQSEAALSLVSRWMKNGTLEVLEYYSPKRRKMAKGLFVKDGIRPALAPRGPRVNKRPPGVPLKKKKVIAPPPAKRSWLSKLIHG